MSEIKDKPVPGPNSKLWMQVVLMLALAVLAQAIGLSTAYVSRCKPGQGNDWCGLGSVAGVVFGFGAALCILVVGSILIFLRHKRSSGGSKIGVLRILSVVFGVLLLLPCAWMLGVGWQRTRGDGGLWLGLGLGLGLIVAAFIRRTRT
jgi:hypothetical protein